jgi:hypothetical protein
MMHRNHEFSLTEHHRIRGTPAHALLLLALLPLLGGCWTGWADAVVSPGSSRIDAGSIADGRTLATTLPTAVYAWLDENTADIYMTDLPLDRLADLSDDLDDLAGSIVHVQLFLTPHAGKTPIDDTAVNVAIRHAIISRGAAGLYSGAGFALTGEPGNPQLRGRLRQGTVRLALRTPDFADLLGPARISGVIAAQLDEPTASVLSRRMTALRVTLESLAVSPR